MTDLVKSWEPDFNRILLFDAEFDLVKVLRGKLLRLGIFSKNIFYTNDEGYAINVVHSGVGNVLSGIRSSEGGSALDLVQEYLNYVREGIRKGIKLVFWVADVPQTEKLINKFSEQIKDGILIFPKQGGIDPAHFPDFFKKNFPGLLPNYSSGAQSKNSVNAVGASSSEKHDCQNSD